MSDQPQLRVGLIGYGLAGSVFHAPLIAATPGLILETIVSADPLRAAQASARYPQARVVDTVEALWTRPPDLVVIASANRSHAPLALRALQAGTAVVVDKPLAANAADAQAVVDCAQAGRLLLSVFHNRRWDGDFLTVQQLQQQGRLGRIHRFESRFERWRPQPRPGWRQLGDPADGGGVLLDLGSHLIDQAVHLFGSVSTLYAELDRRHPDSVVEDDAFVALTHVDGTRSHLWMSSMAAHTGPRLRVLGSAGAYIKQDLDGQEDALRNGVRADDPAFGHEPKARFGMLTQGDHIETIATLPGRWSGYYADIARSIREQVPPAVLAQDSLYSLRLCEAAQASARRQRVVEIDSATGAALGA